MKGGYKMKKRKISKEVREQVLEEYFENLKKENQRMTSGLNVYNYCEDLIHSDQEVVRVLILDSKLKVITHADVSIGTANASIAHPRDIFKKAIINNGVSIILVHNHPSGNPTPSNQDYDLTETVKKSGEILDIKMLDHIIIGKNKFFSFASRQQKNVL